jgi:hypothetical protein
MQLSREIQIDWVFIQKYEGRAHSNWFFPESRRIAYYANVIWDAIKVQSQVDDKTYKSFDMHSRRLLMRFFRSNSFNSESDFYFRLLKKKILISNFQSR